MDEVPLEGWTPIRLYWNGADPWLDWCLLSDARFTEPFFDETLHKRLQHPFHLLFRPQTPLTRALDLARQNPGISPTGFIFHLSRCGSTLITQMLARLPQNIVLSEAGPIDAMLKAQDIHPHFSEEERIGGLRAIVSALAQRRFADERHCFVKFDSWNVMELPLISRAFPDVPWVFLYRDPLEVMVSQVQLRGSQMFPGVLDCRRFSINSNELFDMSLDEYGVRLLTAICSVAADHAQSPRCLLLNYSQLPDAVFSTLLDHFGVAFSDEELQEMRQAVPYHGKDPSRRFENDSIQKRSQATDTLRRLVDEWVQPHYERLESLRCEAAKTTSSNREAQDNSR